MAKDDKINCDFIDNAVHCLFEPKPSSVDPEQIEDFVEQSSYCSGAYEEMVGKYLTEVHVNITAGAQLPEILLSKIPALPLVTTLVFSGEVPWSKVQKVTAQMSSKLESLSIHCSLHNQKIDADFFVGMTSLHTLNASASEIHGLPGGLFSKMGAQLQKLDLSDNWLDSFDAAVFSPLKSLRLLNVSQNQLTNIEKPLLSSLSRLEQLDFSRNRIGNVEEGAFASLTLVYFLSMMQNRICSLPEDIFRELTSLRHLDLGTNRISILGETIFDNLRLLEILNLGTNTVGPHLQAGTFDQLQNLQEIDVSNNNIETVGKDLLRRATNLSTIIAAHNKIGSLDHATFDTLTQLKTLDFSFNNLTDIHLHSFGNVHNLRVLRLQRNHFSKLPGNQLKELPNLKELLLDENFITSIPSGVFRATPALTVLQISSNRISDLPAGIFDPLVELRALTFTDNRLEELPTGIFHKLGGLQLLSFFNNRITRLAPGVFDTNTELSVLYFGGNQLSTLPPGVFDKLEHLTVLSLRTNHFTEISANLFRHNIGLTKLSVAENKIAHDLSDTLKPLQKLLALNVSYNPELTLQSQPWRRNLLNILDVSGTNVTVETEMCRQGTSLALRSMKTATISELTDLIRRCLPLVRVLDLSNNTVLDNLTALQPALDEYHVDLPISPDDDQGDLNLAVLQIEKSPIQCLYEMGTESRNLPPSLVGSESLPTDLLPALVFRCQCNTGYQDRDGTGVCKPEPPFWTPARIVGLTVGTVTVVFIALFVTFRKKHRRRKRKYNTHLELQQGLLEESLGEVLELKRAWEIDHTELSLTERIDVASEGAMGEVWRASWSGLEVAVKVLRAALRELDSSVVGEFEREIDFMQRTRHANIVRFFGAGKMPDGTPFLVEELMACGSLKLVVRDGGCSSPERKYSLACDVARGMAHIHALGHIHRDLKSGNVLIAASGSAKVADFGSVGRLLRGQRHAAPTRNSAAGLRLADAHNDLTVGVGTPLYMSMEMLSGTTYNHATDLWSFGVLLWEIWAEARPDLFTALAKTPGKGPFLSQFLSTLQSGDRLPIDELWPAGVRQLTEQCWLADPRARPSFEQAVEVLGAGLKSVEGR